MYIVHYIIIMYLARLSREMVVLRRNGWRVCLTKPAVNPAPVFP